MWGKNEKIWKNMVPLHPLGTQISRNKFHWLCATYTGVKDHNNVKLLPKPPDSKLMVSQNFLNSVQAHVRFVLKNVLLDIL